MGETSFVAINYGISKKSKWVDMVSVVDGQVYLRVCFEDLTDPSKWNPGWIEEKRSDFSKI